MQFALALATCVLAQPLAEAPARHARMTLYYIPFAAETYVAVTEKTIKKGAYHTIEVDSPERIAALEAVLADRKGKGRFNRSSVRLLVVPQSPATADILPSRTEARGLGEGIGGPTHQSGMADGRLRLEARLRATE